MKNNHRTCEHHRTGKQKSRFPWEVVDRGLCVRCGACSGLCPKSLLALDPIHYPVLEDAQRQCDSCGACMRACPGQGVDVPELSTHVFGKSSDYFDILGIYKEAVIGYSSDSAIRRAGSSGGMVTQILVSLLEKGYIKKALVAGMSASQPWKGRPLLATQPEQIIECAQSKYTIVPQMKLLNELIHSDEDCALVGLPCHIHAFRKYQARFPKKLNNVKMVIGLFCHMALEIEATERVLDLAGIRREDLLRMEYRGGEWPGKLQAHLKSGEIRALHTGTSTDGAFNYLKYMYYPPRCLFCIDFSAELADISVGDPWLRGKNGKYIYQGGHSLLLVRNHKAGELISTIEKSGEIHIEPVDESLLMQRYREMTKYKKMGAQIRIEALKRRAIPYPEYHYDLEPPAWRDIFREKVSNIPRALGKTRRRRALASRIAFSGIGAVLTLVKRLTKEALTKYRYQYGMRHQ